MKKYRVWDEVNKSWIPSEYLMMNPEGVIYTSLHKDDNTYMAETIPLKICFSTGLLDRHGKEIYERDILRIINNKQQIQTIELIGKVVFGGYGSYRIDDIKKVKWEKFSNGVEPPEYMWFLNIGDRGIEIIGNFYENPELLENKL